MKNNTEIKVLELAREIVESRAAEAWEKIGNAPILCNMYVELRKGGYHEQAQAFKSMCFYGFILGKSEETIAREFLALAK